MNRFQRTGVCVAQYLFWTIGLGAAGLFLIARSGTSEIFRYMGF